MCFTRQRAFPATTPAVSAARDFASASLVSMLEPRGWPVADDAVLVVSELMTACMEAHAARIDVRLHLHYDTVRIEVVGEAVPLRISTRPLIGARAQILDGVTLQASFDTDGDDAHGIAYLPCDPAFTRRLACEHRPHSATVMDN
jgi:hypothetical protein